MRVKGLDINVTERDKINVAGDWLGNPGELRALIRVLADVATSVDLMRRERLRKKLEEKLPTRGTAQQDTKNLPTKAERLKSDGAVLPHQKKEGKDDK